jgi:hypothetical protein
VEVETFGCGKARLLQMDNLIIRFPYRRTLRITGEPLILET